MMKSVTALPLAVAPGPAWRLVLLGGLAALLSACGSTPTRETGTAAKPVPRAEVPASRPAPKARRGGGYYKDDGPDDNPPDNLDAVPDAQPRLEPLHRFANRPYNVFGKDYVPITRLGSFRERGLASWYGRRFHGLDTSSGEPYDMYGMTAAHPTLPIPSYARVTNVSNGRSVVVRVNDRGPFHEGRVIDLSYTAAYRLGYVNSGSTQVEVEQVLPDSVLPEVAAPSPGLQPPRRATEPAAVSTIATRAVADPESPGRGIFLQLGAFNSRDNAEDFRANAQRELASLAERIDLFAEDGRFRLHAGPYASEGEARLAAERIAAVLKLKPFVVVR